MLRGHVSMLAWIICGLMAAVICAVMQIAMSFEVDLAGVMSEEEVAQLGPTGAALSGYSLVAANGSNDRAYAIWDLDGRSVK